jgi:hypothetical protein
MKKTILSTIGCAVCCLFLAACGGTDDKAVADDNSAADNAKAVLNVQVSKTTFQPAMVESKFVHLSDGTKEVSVDKKHVVKVFWNGPAVGWHITDATKGVDLGYDWSFAPVFTIAGQPLSPSFGGNFSFLIDDGRELSQITDAKWLTIIVGNTMLAERKADGLLYASNTGTAPPVPVVILKTLVDVNTVTGTVEITPVIVSGKLTNLVNSNPTEQVMDPAGIVIAGYQLVWNDNGSWYPASGKITPLIMPKTSITGAAKSVGLGSGMPYLVKPDGTSVPFNTDHSVCTFMVNGVVKTVGTDGLMSY